MTLLRWAWVLAILIPLAAHPKPEEPLPQGVETLAFTPREMLDFDIPAYLADHAPELASEASAIGHWSAYYHISPKALIALMKHQSDPRATRADEAWVDLERPFGDLSAQQGFHDQLIDVAARLSAQYHPASLADVSIAPGERVQRALVGLLGARYATGMAEELRRYGDIYQDLFPGGPGEEPPTALPQAAAVSSGISFQFPWPTGESWRGGGAHSSQMQSLDFLAGFHDWGDPDVFNHWVAAANGGTVRVWSECGLSVIDPTGTWVSDYYHLENIQVSDQATIVQDQVLANYADDEATATCRGGSSTGPHVHFSIARDDQWQPIHNRVLSAFRVHMVSEESYDTNCEVSYYDPINGDPKVCPWSALSNSGAVAEPLFVLTVNGGSGSGEYTVGTVVEVAAEEAEPGFVFKEWAGDTGPLADATAAMTSFTMGDENAEITATYEEVAPTLFLLEVIDGTGDGEYAAGTPVEVSANEPADGMEFDRWVGNTEGLASVEAATTVLTMPDANVEIAATYRNSEPLVFVLEVINGTGDGEYTAGTEVEVAADAPDEGMVFDRWVGNTAGLANVEAATTVMTMPDANVEIAATYRSVEPPLFVLEVIKGSGDGEYAAGTEVEVVADAPAEGMVFDRWVGNTEGLANVEAPVTVLVMPDANIEIAATYRSLEPQTFVLEVIHGSGDGEYAPGTVVEVVADAADEGEVFDRWVGNTDGLANVEAAATVLTMPEADVEIVATYREAPPGEGPFVLEVVGGSGSGEYAPGTVVDVEADEAPEGMRLERWMGHIDGLAHVERSATRYTMPEHPAELIAKFVERPDPECGGRPDFDDDGIRDDCDSEVTALTGSWFDPDSAGEGFMVHGVSESLAVVYFYGYDLDGKRLWLIGTSSGPFSWDEAATFRVSRVSGGQFTEFDPSLIDEDPIGWIDMRLDDCNTGFARLRTDLGTRLLRIVRLGDVARSPCSNSGRARESDVLTGSWFDPDSAGQGFAVHKMTEDFGVVYFYGFDDNGDNLWLLGNWNTPLDLGQTVVIELLKVSGGTYDEVDPAQILEEPWGTLTLRVDSCDSGTATLDGETGFQVLDLEQLAGSLGMECP